MLPPESVDRKLPAAISHISLLVIGALHRPDACIVHPLAVTQSANSSASTRIFRGGSTFCQCLLCCFLDGIASEQDLPRSKNMRHHSGSQHRTCFSTNHYASMKWRAIKRLEATQAKKLPRSLKGRASGRGSVAEADFDGLCSMSKTPLEGLRIHTVSPCAHTVSPCYNIHTLWMCGSWHTTVQLLDRRLWGSLGSWRAPPRSSLCCCSSAP